MAWTIKQHDTLPSLVAILRETDGTPIDLTDVISVSLVIKQKNGVVQFKKTAIVNDDINGIVQFNWSGTDTNVAGDFNGEFEIIWPGGIQTVPNNGYFDIIIKEDLG